MKQFIYVLLVAAMVTGIWYGQSLFWALGAFAFFGVFTVGLSFFLLKKEIKEPNYTHLLFWVSGGLFFVFVYIIIFYHNMPLVNLIISAFAIISEYLIFKFYFKNWGFMPVMIGYPSCFVFAISIFWMIIRSCGWVLREDGPTSIICLILILSFVIAVSFDYWVDYISSKIK